jgi:hypothetical protein
VYGAFEIDGALPRAWALDVNLWTEEEGVSDLTLQIRATDSHGEYYSVAIEDLHVL